MAFGPDAILAELDDAHEVRALDRALRGRPHPGVDEIVPAARSVLVVFDPADTTRDGVSEWISRCAAAASVLHDFDSDVVEVIELRVRYDGADLGDVAAAAGLTERELIERHTSAELTVAFCGFAPGFAYLEGFDLGVDVPRRAAPRTMVPAGSVAVAARYTAVYPSPLPGGWQLIGTCLDRVFDLAVVPPTTLAPGRCVRFIEAT